MTFKKWLLKQTERDDPIGDLARDFVDDARMFPQDYRGMPNKRHMWSYFFCQRGACMAAMESFEAAWQEYERGAGRARSVIRG